MSKFKPNIILVTGAAGFIGAALCNRLLNNSVFVIGIDDLNSYYDPKLKKSRLENIKKNKFAKDNWIFCKGKIENYSFLKNIIESFKPNVIVNLAAQAGVRYSLENPFEYVQTNLVGFCNILEVAKKYSINNLIYASSSSVYGANKTLPYCEIDNSDHPVSFYAASKRSNELLAHSYSHLFNIPCTGLRFFTVYGPWGRPDMAPMIFAKSILRNEELFVFNNGEMSRDFTYIDDVTEAIWRCCLKPATPDNKFDLFDPNPSSSFAPHRIFNVGNGSSINLLEFITILEKELGIPSKKVYKPFQPGDVKDTHANTDKLKSWIDFKPQTSLETGLHIFAKWFLEYYA